jgi:ABC-type nitrate/sulfonate/bicarbonate transport system substrate-binding protein
VLKLGFVPLADCAPIVMAQELGLFRKYGLRVMLNRELGWATIRDKVIHGELDAAHALAAMPVAATLGLGSIECECVTALVLNLNGNAITLSDELYRSGVRDGAGLREQIIARRHRKTFTFGIVSQFSSHNFLLGKWLSASGINPGRDVRIVVVPPPQMVTNLKADHLDGFCVGEPWNSVAVQSKVGWCVATSAELNPGHPEKVLMARREFAENRNEEHLALVAALLEACEYCDDAGNHDHLVAVLARPEYVSAPATALRRGFEGNFDFGHGNVRKVPDFTIFHRNNANEPSGDKAAWVFERIRSSGLCRNPSGIDFALGRKVFRTDLYDQANRIRSQSNNYETESQLTH